MDSHMLASVDSWIPSTDSSHRDLGIYSALPRLYCKRQSFICIVTRKLPFLEHKLPQTIRLPGARRQTSPPVRVPSQSNQLVDHCVLSGS